MKVKELDEGEFLLESENEEEMKLLLELEKDPSLFNRMIEDWLDELESD